MIHPHHITDMIETEVKVESTSTLPEEKKDKELRCVEQKEQKPRSPRGSRRQGAKEDGLDERNLEKEFKTFALTLRKQFGEDALAYQISNYPEGLEFLVRVAKKSGGEGARFTKRPFAANFSGNKRTQKKELTEEQKARRAEKQAKRREYFEKKKQERLEKEESGVKEEPGSDGDATKQSQ